MENMYYIGIDLGTSSVKLLLMDDNGHIVDTVSRDYPISYPRSGWSEQEPEDWYNETIAGISKLITGIDKSQVAGISFGGQMHGLVILDENDQVIRPAILWNDGRSEEQCDYLNNVIGRDVISEATANIAFAGFTAPKLLWVRDNEPENFKKIHKIMLPKDYLAYRLTGVFSTDVSDASGMLLMDVKNRCWSQVMLAICGINENMLPTIYESYECIGCVKQEAADFIGINHNVKVAAGAGDNAAAAVGTGTLKDESCNISIGTSGTVFISCDKFALDANNALHSFAHANGRYHLMGCILSAASCNRWWMEDILNTSEFEKEQDGLKALGTNDVYYLPYMMGERSPHNDATARGAFIGLSMNTTRKAMTLAVMEGVAYALRDCVEVARKLGLNITKTRICGGGAKSRLWVDIIANVLNCEVERIESEEGPALGAAILAAVACRRYETVEAAADDIVHVVEVIKPEPDTVAAYDERYKTYIKLYPALKGIKLS